MKNIAQKISTESGENKNTVCNGKNDCQKVVDEPSTETGRVNEGALCKTDNRLCRGGGGRDR